MIDPLRKVAHLRNAVGDLLAEQHSTAAGLCSLTDNDLDRIGAAKVVGVHAVARREQLVHELLRVAALFFGHAAVTGRRAGADGGRAAAERLFRLRREGAEAHAGNRDRNVELDRVLGVARAERHGRVAALAVALERVARNARAEQQQVIEVRHLALRAKATNVVDPFAGFALDLMDYVAVKECGFAHPRAGC